MPNERKQIPDSFAEESLLREDAPERGFEQNGRPLHRWSERLLKQEELLRQKRELAERKALPDQNLMLAAVPFWALGSGNLRNAIILCVALFVILIPSSCLYVILNQKLQLRDWVALPVTVAMAATIASVFCAALMQAVPGAYDSLGIYLFLLAAAPVLQQAEKGGKPQSHKEAWMRIFRFILDFSVIILLCGLIREVVGYNTILGNAVKFPLRTDAARQPFFGLMLSGLMLAVMRSGLTLLRRVMHRRKQVESKGQEAAE